MSLPLDTLHRLVGSYPVMALVLFGSQARGDAREDSDYDLCLIPQQGYSFSTIDKTQLQQEFDDTFRREKIDLVFFESLPLMVKFSVVSDGKPLLVSDVDTYTDLVDVVVRDYLDFKPFYRKYLDEMAETVTKGEFYA